MFPRRLITEGPDRYFALKRASSNLLSGRTVNYTYDDLYRILSFVGRQEKIESRVGFHATFRHPDLVRTFLAFGLLTFGSLLSTLAVSCTRQRCARVVPNTCGNAFQKGY